MSKTRLGSPILCAEVVIVGGGFAGSVLAHVLARRGVDVMVVDLHAVYPPDFRCEKFNPDQIALLRALGVLGCLEATGGEGAGELASRGLRYETMINAIRGDWSADVAFIKARVLDIATGPDRQTLTLSTGEMLEARLVVLATGQSPRLGERLGLRRRVLCERQSVSIGFSIVPDDDRAPPVGGLTHAGERCGDHMAFASLFPMDGAMRVNVFSYHDPRLDWLRRFREDPIGQLCAAMPGLSSKLAGERVVGPVEIRATDLYETEGHIQDGLVLIGDAFRSSCPATGTGVGRALADARQLAFEHLPRWLATPGMDQVKIAQFYADPAKRAIDQRAVNQSRRARAAATLTSPLWRCYRALARVKRRLRELSATARTA